MKISLLSILFIPFIGFAQSEVPKTSCKASPTPLFQNDELLEIKMEGSFPASSESKSAEIQYVDKNNTEKSIPVMVTKRGKSRGYRCSFTPIRITWTEDQKDLSRRTIFKNIKGRDMKLTTHCKYTSGTIEQNQETNELVIKEYIIYKILKAFDLPAFDVRLTKVVYTDKDNSSEVEGMGFFIESSSQYADRCSLSHANQAVAREAFGNMNKQIYIPYLFARLISDARDYVVEYGHNSELFLAEKQEKSASNVAQIVTPYDFNDSGQVNSGIAPYWNFSPDWEKWFNLLKEGPFTRDGYLSPRLTSEEKAAWTAGLAQQAKQLVAKKQAVLNVIDNSPLSSESKKQFKAHIEMLIKQFKKIIKNPSSEK